MRGLSNPNYDSSVVSKSSSKMPCGAYGEGLMQRARHAALLKYSPIWLVQRVMDHQRVVGGFANDAYS